MKSTISRTIKAGRLWRIWIPSIDEACEYTLQVTGKYFVVKYVNRNLVRMNKWNRNGIQEGDNEK